MDITGFEIDFLPVGKGASGDAIFFRYKDESGDYKVILIDGGYQDTADTILKHMKEHYYPEYENYSSMRIDHIVCSHPDQDHIGGLAEIIEKCDVRTLWINRPLDYISKDKLPDKDDEGRFTKNKAGMVEDLIKVAENNNVHIDAPLQGVYIGPLCVCSPSKEFYKDIIEDTLEWKSSSERGIMERVIMLVNETMAKISWIPAEWTKDALYQHPKTSSANETSTVLFGNLMNEEYKILLTADAGIEALTRAQKYLYETQNFEAGLLTLMQIPHHASRRNVNSAILDDLLGYRIPKGSAPSKGTSYASTAKDDEKHPRKSVLNAFHTRGYNCFCTEGRGLWYHEGEMPQERDGYSTATPEPFAEKVESTD